MPGSRAGLTASSSSPGSAHRSRAAGVCARRAARTWLPGTRSTGNAAQQLLDGQQALRVNQFQKPKLKMKPLLLPVIQIVECAQHDLQIARQLFLAEQHCRARRSRPLIGRNLQQFGLLATQLRHQRVAQVANQLPGQRLRTVAGIHQPVRLFHQLCALCCRHGIH